MKCSNILFEKFGAPLNPIYGTKSGDVEDITNVGLVGVRDEADDVIACSVCGEIPSEIESACSCGLTRGDNMYTQCGTK